MTVVFAILLFSFLIFIHELGHFVAAKLSGVQVNEFSMFMGPAIFKWGKGETQYTIRCIPLGGYCAMEGEDGDSDNPRAFSRAKWWKRLIILFAGAFMNFITGVVIIAVLLSCSKAYVDTSLISVEPASSVAAEGGLQAGDQIVRFDGESIEIYEDFALKTLFLEDGQYDLTVIRNGKKLNLEKVPFVKQDFGDGNGMRYGISFGTEKTTAGSVLSQIWPQAKYQVKTVFFSLKMLFTGQAGLKDVSGPVGIVKMMSDTAATTETAFEAFLTMLSFGGMLAINLAVMNLLPIPALDGGRIFGLVLTTLIEKITKKKLDPKYEGYVHAVGMVLLLGLMAVILFKDVFMIFKG